MFIVGDYTAGAVASICFDAPEPAVDGNVLRVLSRVTQDEAPVTRPAVKKAYEAALRPAYEKNPGKRSELTQSLMELGACVCVPNGAPKCAACPLREICCAGESGAWSRLPVKEAKKPRRVEEKTVFFLQCGGQYAVRRRPETGLLAGLWELPNVEGNMGQEEVLSMVKEMGYAPIRIQPLGEAKHIFSHIEWYMTGYAVRVEEPEMHPQVQCEKNRADGLLFVEAEDAKEKYAIPSAFAAYAKYMNILLGNEKKA